MGAGEGADLNLPIQTIRTGVRGGLPSPTGTTHGLMAKRAISAAHNIGQPPPAGLAAGAYLLRSARFCLGPRLRP